MSALRLSGRAFLVVDVVYSRSSGKPYALRVRDVRQRRPKAQPGQIVVDLTVSAPSPSWAMPVVDVDLGDLEPPPDAISVDAAIAPRDEGEGSDREGF